MATLITNARMIRRNNELLALDLWLEGGKIKAFGQNFSTLTVGWDLVIDAQGGLVIPGMVDLHVHLREPGYVDKETVATGTLAAAKGGFTTVCAMPNTNPVPDSVDVLRQIQALIDKDAVVKVYPYGSITENLRSEQLVDMEGMTQAGAIAFTNDGVGVQTAGTMYLAMEEAARLGSTIIAHTEDESLLFGGCIHEGEASRHLGLPGIKSVVESTQIARDVLLAQATGVHYHVCHVSTKESVEVIRQAKRNGVHVTAEVCPHHLLLTDQVITHKDTNFKMNPPLREEADRQALIEGLLDGTIDCIVTDHAPHCCHEKAQSMEAAPFGIVGSEHAFSLMYTEFVQTGIFSLAQLIDWLTVKPAELLNLPAGRLEVGGYADLAIIDLEATEVIDPKDFASKARNTPFIGKQVTGLVTHTLVDGHVVYQRKDNK